MSTHHLYWDLSSPSQGCQLLWTSTLDVSHLHWARKQDRINREFPLGRGRLACAQFLTVYARTSSTCARWISSLNHKVLFKKMVLMLDSSSQGIRTHRNYSMEYDAVIVSSFYEFSKVFACLYWRRLVTPDCPRKMTKETRTRGAWFQYNSNWISPKLVSNTTESIGARGSMRLLAKQKVEGACLQLNRRLYRWYAGKVRMAGL